MNRIQFEAYIFYDIEQNNFSSIISHFIVLLFWNVNQFNVFKYMSNFLPELETKMAGTGDGHDQNIQKKIKTEQNDKNRMKIDPHKRNGQIFHHYIIR